MIKEGEIEEVVEDIETPPVSPIGVDKTNIFESDNVVVTPVPVVNFHSNNIKDIIITCKIHSDVSCDCGHPQCRNTVKSFRYDSQFIYYQKGKCIYQFDMLNGEKKVYKRCSKTIRSFYVSRKFMVYGTDDEDFAIKFNDCKEEKSYLVEGNGYGLNALDVSKDEKRIVCAAQSDVFFMYNVNYETFELELSYCYDIKSYANDTKFSTCEKYVGVTTDGEGYYIFIINEEKVINIKSSKYCDLCSFNCDSTMFMVCGQNYLRFFSLSTMKEVKVIVLTSSCSIAKFSPVNKSLFCIVIKKIYCVGNDISNNCGIIGELNFKNEVSSMTLFDEKYETNTTGMCFNLIGSKIFLQFDGRLHEGIICLKGCTKTHF